MRELVRSASSVRRVEVLGDEHQEGHENALVLEAEIGGVRGGDGREQPNDQGAPNSNNTRARGAGMRTFLLVLCLFVFCQSTATTGLMGAVIGTIEQRYGFSSTKSGMMFSTYDMAVIFVIVPLSFHGGRYHKPRMLGLGWFVLGIASLLFALPQLLSGKYEASAGYTGHCSATNVQDCGNSDAHQYYVFVLSQAIFGLGSATLYTLGPTYMSANLPEDKVPLYLGVMYGVAALGPAFGFVVGGKTLDLYVDPGTETDLTPSDPQWVGAWWLMFVVLGGISVFASSLFLMFPRSMRKATWTSTATQMAVRQERPKEGGFEGGDSAGPEKPSAEGPRDPAESPQQPASSNKSGNERRMEFIAASAGNATDVVVSLRFDGSIAEPPKSMYQGVMEVLRNPVWVTNALGGAGEALVVSAFAAFMAKMLQSQFALTSSRAAFLTGMVLIPGAAGGTFGGGAIVKYFRLSFIQTTRLCVLFACVSMCLCGMFFLGCDEAKVVGVNQHYAESNAQQEPYDIHSACNADCACVEQDYDPVCGSDERTYLNACLAGCRFHNTTSTYSECACVGGEATAKGGPCPAPGDCDSTLSAFLGLLFLLMLTTFANNTPATVVQLRVLGDEVAPVGLSLHSVMFRVLGTIPGPILYGALLDTTCEVKSKGCGRDSCELYDPAAMRHAAAWLAFVGKGISALMFTLSWRLAARKLEEAKRSESPPTQPC